MNIRKILSVRFLNAFFCLTLSLLTVSAAHGQIGGSIQGSSISGHVFGAERVPVPDIFVELLNEYSQTIQRARTNGAGRYFFSGLGAGRYNVRVLPYGTNFDEQTIEVEIYNNPFARESSTGVRSVSGLQNAQQDFYLRPRRNANSPTGAPEAIFAQEVPPEAKKLYEKGLSQLSDKKEKEAFESLKSSLEIFPKYYAALDRLGNEYVRLGHYGAARILLSMAVDVNPRGYNSWYGLAYASYSLKQNNESANAIKKALDLYPDSARALLLSGVMMRQNKNFTEAEKQLVKARDLAQKVMPEVHYHLGLLYGEDLKRYGDAAKELKLFLKAQPNTKDAENIKLKIKEFEEKAKTS